jgi:hypothetical protein
MKDDVNAAALPARLLSRGGGGGAEDRLAALMRAAAPAEGLSPAARDRVWQRLDGRDRRGRPVATLRWSFALGVLLASGGVVAAMSAPRWWPKLRRTQVETATPPPPAPVRPRAPTPSPAAAPPEAANPIEAPAAIVDVPATVIANLASAPTRRAPTPTQPEPRERDTEPSAPEVRGPRPETPPQAGAPPEAREAPPEARVAPPPSALAAETALLAEALTRLRQHRDPAGALAALDAYDARAPRGTLRREADGARVDALIMLGRDGDALAVLRTLALQPRGRDQELRVVRGELAAAQDCAGAVADFDRVLADGPPARLVERALHGRATCLARLGDSAAARRDLLEYLRRFPEGRFAAEARRLAGDGDQ